MGRLVNEDGRQQVVLDEVGGEITVTKSKRLFGKKRRTFRTSEIRHLELGYNVKGPIERFAVVAVLAGPEEEKLPLASYEGFEGWADPEEWREFTGGAGALARAWRRGCTRRRLQRSDAQRERNR